MTPAAGTPPIVNTHVHMPPNFSAFHDIDDVIATGVAEGARAIGISNFYDQNVYTLFAEKATAAGIVPLFGLEMITFAPDLAERGVRVNDPANAGRYYICGKGISPFREKTPEADRIATEIRQGNDERAAAQVEKVRLHMQHSAVPGADALTVEAISADVARRGGVPVEWVSLQERHIARAAQEVLAGLPKDVRLAALDRLYGQPSGVDVDNAVALQGEIRSRLLKTGAPAFVPEVPLSFDDAYRYILDMGGIPVYPTLADGADPICEYETPAADLAADVIKRHIYAAELIPIRNKSACVDEYVRAFRDAGLVVVAGTEHNTADRIPLDPACVDGPLSAYARQAFWEGTCVVAAHQRLVAQGEPGFVDATGARTAQSVDDLIELGASIITASTVITTTTEDM